MSDRFYTPRPLGPGEFVLDGPEAHHLAAVRRFAPGDRVTLFNGDGFDYPAEVVAIGKKTASLAVLDRVVADRELGFPLVVASAVPKGDRGDYLIEKLTELGATRFVPLVTARSVVVPKSEKLARAVIEASKQCGRNVLMDVEPPAPWGEFASRAGLPATKLILHTDGGIPIALLFAEEAFERGPEHERRVVGSSPSPLVGEGRGGGRHEPPKEGTSTPETRSPPTLTFPHKGGGNKAETAVDRASSADKAGVVIAVGPEGGFDPDEVQLAVASGWRPVSLGRRILRVETAATAAVASLAALAAT